MIMIGSNFSQFESLECLTRVKSLLQSISPQSLFFAGRELCHGIRARIQETLPYLDVRHLSSDSSQSKIDLFNLEKSVLDLFRFHDRVAQVIIYHSSRDEGEDSFYYTPVTIELIDLGRDILEFSMIHPNPDPFWNDKEFLVKKTLCLFETCCKGELAVHPLFDASKGELTLTTFDGGVIKISISALYNDYSVKFKIQHPSFIPLEK